MKTLINITFTLVKMAWKKTLPASSGGWSLSTRTFRGERKPMTEWSWVSLALGKEKQSALNVVNKTGVWDAVKVKYVDVDGKPVTTAGWNNC